MKETAYYRRAFDEAPFRRAQLDELRYFKKVEVGMLSVAAAGFVLHTLCFGLAEQKWDSGWVWLAIVGVSGASYLTCATRLGALEVIEEKAGTSAKSDDAAPLARPCAGSLSHTG